MMKENYDKLILDALLDKGIIDDELYEKCSKNTVSLIEKNHDYFSRIRGQIRAITDSKEEYKALRDDILGHYKDYRVSQTVYAFRMAKTRENHTRFGKELSDETIYYKKEPNDSININHDVVSGVKGEKFAVGFNKDFTKKESCFEYEHIKEMDNSGLKYFWTLGKNGVMITKYDANSYDELPRNSKNQIDTKPRLVDALSYDNIYAPIYFDMFNNSKYGKECDKQERQFFKENNRFPSYEEVQKPLVEKFLSEYHKECVKLVDSNLQKAGLINQVTGEPLFKFAYAKSGK